MHKSEGSQRLCVTHAVLCLFKGAFIVLKVAEIHIRYVHSIYIYTVTVVYRSEAGVKLLYVNLWATIRMSAFVFE